MALAVPPKLAPVALPPIAELKPPAAFVAATRRAQKIAASLNAALGIETATIAQNPPALTRGTARTLFPNLTSGRGWRLVTGIIRPTTSGGVTSWYLLTDVNHRKFGTASIAATPSYLTVNFDNPNTLVAWSSVTPDETFSYYWGVSAGPSQNLGNAEVRISCNRVYRFRLVGSASSASTAYSVTSNGSASASDHGVVQSVSYNATNGVITCTVPDGIFDTTAVQASPLYVNDSYLQEVYVGAGTSSTFTIRFLNRGTGWYNGSSSPYLQANISLPLIGRPNLTTTDFGALTGTVNLWFAALVFEGSPVASNGSSSGLAAMRMRSRAVAQARSLDWSGKSLIRPASKVAPRPRAKPIRVAARSR
jgi:hypothetical protein